MKLDVVGEGVLEKLALASGAVPSLFMTPWMGKILGRVMMAAVKFRVFDELEGGELTAGDIASRCGMGDRATSALLIALTGMGCMRQRGERYALTRAARKWLP